VFFFLFVEGKRRDALIGTPSPDRSPTTMDRAMARTQR
jgi:hypothetical protein